jgi:hypothetical protein
MSTTIYSFTPKTLILSSFDFSTKFYFEPSKFYQELTHLHCIYHNYNLQKKMIVFSNTAIIITLIHLKMPFLDTKIKIKKINKSISVGVQFNSSKSQFNQLKVKRKVDYL